MTSGESKALEDLYVEGEYLERHPTWHTEDSPWKAAQVLRMLERNSLAPSKVCEVGCGAGEILRQLQDRLDGHPAFVGYEISPQAYQLTLDRARPGLEFKLEDFLESPEPDVDLLLLMDVIEHVPDYLGFLSRIRGKATNTILHIPLDLSVEWLVRGRPLINERRTMGHLHYFTKDLALEALTDSGFEVVDWFYTRWGIDNFYPTWRVVRDKDTPVKTGLRKALQHSLWRLSPDLAARLTRGWALLVLVR